MRALSTTELLTIWERGQSEPHYDRAMILLAAACPEEPPDVLAKISIGSRDARLLTLRELTFGPRLTGVVGCPACGERLEITVHIEELRTVAPEATGDAFILEMEEYRVDFRLPGTIDLRETSSSGDRESMHAELIRRCILKASRNDEEVATDKLPAPLMETLVARMAEQDPQADSQLSLACPSCSHRWNALFDIVSFFWSEIQAWAVRILREVHILASAYGWREADILAMSPLRRQSYLSMVAL
jgi:hypothetical protein